MQQDTFGLGRRPDLDAELDRRGVSGLTAGRVVAQHRGHWLVALTAPGGSGPRLFGARGRLRVRPPVAGDWVAIDAGGAICAVLDRRGVLSRRAAGKAPAEQILAANVDLALVVEPLPEPNDRRAERFLALARGGIGAALVLTKADLEPDGQAVAARAARRLGIADAIAVSAHDGTGLQMLRGLLEPGATAVLLGRSGAGKSTLVNALLGERRQATRPVRASDGRGRHATVTRELIALPDGALIVDTPGLREVGLWDGPDATFADIARLAGGCRFADCRHAGEPGCAVRGAVDDARLAAWRKLEREQSRLDVSRRAERERKESARALSRQARATARWKGRA